LGSKILVQAIEDHEKKITKDPSNLSCNDQYFYCWVMQTTQLGPQRVESIFQGAVKQAHGHLVEILLTHRLLDISQILYSEVPSKNMGTTRPKDVFLENIRAPSVEASVNILKKAVSKNLKYN
jgi:hypothetical protein